MQSLWTLALNSIPKLPAGMGRVKCASRFCDCYVLYNSRKDKIFCNDECAWREQSAVYADKQKAKKIQREKEKQQCVS